MTSPQRPASREKWNEPFKHAPPLPLPPENPMLNPVRQGAASPGRTGSFANRHEDKQLAKVSGAIDSLQDQLWAIGDNVSTTLREFSSLADRSRDNGAALEKLMTEIKGVRSDDGVSKKLTGLAQLDMLKELDKLEKLDRLDSVVTNMRRHLATNTPTLDAKALEPLKCLENLRKLSILEKFPEITKAVSGVPGIQRALTELASQHQVDRQVTIQQLQKIEDALGQRSGAKSLETEGLAKKLEKLQKLSELDRLQELGKLGILESQLQKIEDLIGRLAPANNSKAIEEIKKQVSMVATQHDVELQNKILYEGFVAKFESLERNCDNLSKLSMLETLSAGFKQIRSDQTTSLEQLQRLKDLTRLEQLDGLKDLSNLEKLDSLKGLGKLDKLVALDRLDELKSLDKLCLLSNLEKLEHVDKLGALDSLAQLGSLEELKKLATLDKLNSLQKLEKLEQLEQLAQLGKLEQLEQLEQLGKLGKLEQLEHLGKLEQLGKLDQLKKLEKLDQLESLQGLDQLRKLDSLESIVTFDFQQLQGEVRAVQDHLCGEHWRGLQETSHLREIVTQQGTELSEYRAAHSKVADLEQRVKTLETSVRDLEDQEKHLIAHNSELKTELRLGAARLSETEARYTRIEHSLRELVLSKYTTVLGSGTLAVLDRHDVSNKAADNKENEIKIPKRQLRSVSLRPDV